MPILKPPPGLLSLPERTKKYEDVLLPLLPLKPKPLPAKIVIPGAGRKVGEMSEERIKELIGLIRGRVGGGGRRGEGRDDLLGSFEGYGRKEFVKLGQFEYGRGREFDAEGHLISGSFRGVEGIRLMWIWMVLFGVAVIVLLLVTSASWRTRRCGGRRKIRRG